MSSRSGAPPSSGRTVRSALDEYNRAIIEATKTKSTAPIGRLLKRGILPPEERAEQIGNLLEHGVIKPPPQRNGRPSKLDKIESLVRLANAAEEAIGIQRERNCDPEEACKIVAAKRGEFHWWSIRNAATGDGGQEYAPIWAERKERAGKNLLRFLSVRERKLARLSS